METKKTCFNDDQLWLVLYRLRRAHKGAELFDGPLMFEEWDWLVVLQCMQDHGLFLPTNGRQPYARFAAWLIEIQMPENLMPCCAKTLSRTDINLKGARYPWREVTWNPHVLVRWRALYRILDKMLSGLEDSGQ
ncbi:MAG: hypothetical protein E7074_04585 [Bacteroidales bacterium]|nr:hypothetical protein [Bacteroidales bacterium]